MDELARFNKERWEELAAAEIEYSRPMLAMSAEDARTLVDPEGVLGELAGKRVLCLAGGGGQQSAAFGLLGARVTVLDLSPIQLDRDRIAAEHYGLSVRLLEGDMRDLSRFERGEFDVVYHAHSINFVPDPVAVFRQVAYVLEPRGLYRVSFTNPFTHTVWEDAWDGKGYSLRDAYEDGEIAEEDPFWEFLDGQGNARRVRGPREFRHKLSTLVNGLANQGFVIKGIWESADGDINAEPGSSRHCHAVAPWWMWMVAQYRPE